MCKTFYLVFDPLRPSNGGKFCIGERKRFKICNTEECPPRTPTFRQLQCSEFDFVPYKNAVYEWEPVPIQSKPNLTVEPVSATSIIPSKHLQLMEIFYFKVAFYSKFKSVDRTFILILFHRNSMPAAL